MSAPARKLPGSLEANPRLDCWMGFSDDGYLTIHTGKIELGQGLLTALLQIVAEELDVPVGRIRIATADTAEGPNEGVTAGSRSIQESGMSLRHVAAEVRELLMSAAATRLGTSVERLSLVDGEIRSADGPKTSLWDIAPAVDLGRTFTPDVRVKPVSGHAIVGASLPRIDIPSKVSGQPVYIQDLELPGMLHARIARPPGPGAELVSVDVGTVLAMPGVKTVVRDGRFLAVVAEGEYDAIRAQRRLARATVWNERDTLPAIADPRFLLTLKSEDEIVRETSIADEAVSYVEAEYSRPYLAHASIGPSCAIACFDDGALRVWTHSQGIHPLRMDLGKALGMPEDAIRVTHVEGAGCYGHNGADDVACDAALIARAVPGHPVRVQWMREDEFGWEPFGSCMVVKMRAGLDAGGKVVSWSHDLWSYSHSTRPSGKDGVNLLGSWHLGTPLPAGTPGNLPLPAGGSHRNALPYYDFPGQKVTNHLIRKGPLRTSALRSLGAHANVFAIESFIDEIALVSGRDPVELRLEWLKDVRARDVIAAVARKAGWKAGERGDGTSGRGIAFARYKNLGSYVAVIAEVLLAEDVRVKRLWAAVDVGQVINPDGVINQIEGGMIQAASWTLREQVKHDCRSVLTRTWGDYPILTFNEAPDVDVTLIDRPEAPPLGAGEGAQGPTSAAIANAICHAAGIRLRDMPFTRETLIQAMVG